MGKQFRQHCSKIQGGQIRELKTKGLLIYNPIKTIICEAQAKKLKEFYLWRIAIGCSSEKERKVNAVALIADEGRDYLR